MWFKSPHIDADEAHRQENRQEGDEDLGDEDHQGDDNQEVEVVDGEQKQVRRQLAIVQLVNWASIIFCKHIFFIGMEWNFNFHASQILKWNFMNLLLGCERNLNMLWFYLKKDWNQNSLNFQKVFTKSGCLNWVLWKAHKNRRLNFYRNGLWENSLNRQNLLVWN